MKPYFKFNLFLLFVLVFCVCPFISEANSSNSECGAKAVIKKDGVNHVVNSTLPYVIQQLKQQDFGDIEGIVDAPYLGKIKYRFYNISLPVFSVDGLELELSSPDIIGISASNLNVELDLNWFYIMKESPHLNGTGTADAEAEHTSIDVAVAVDVDPSSGRPSLKTKHAKVSFGSFKITLKGGVEAWLLDLLEKIFQKKIQNSIEKQLSSAISKVIDQTANKALKSLNLVQPIDDTAEVDFSICGEHITSSSMTFGTRGEFLQRSNPVPAPFPSKPLPDAVNNRMVQMMLSEFSANSAAYVYWRAGKLEYVMQQKDLPPEIPLKLNTTSFKFLIPKLYKQYPNRPMQLNITAPVTPKTKITADGLSVSLVADMHVQVITNNSSSTVSPWHRSGNEDTLGLFDAFTIRTNISTEGNVAVYTQDNNQYYQRESYHQKQQQLMVTGKLKYLDFSLSLVHSNVGHFDPKPLGDLLQVIIQKAMLPFLNTYLGNGFPLPSVKGVTFIQPDVSFHDGFIAISTNINYKPDF